MDKDKIIVSVVIDKQALVDRAFDISKNLSEFNEIKKVIDGKNQFTRDIDEIIPLQEGTCFPCRS